MNNRLGRPIGAMLTCLLLVRCATYAVAADTLHVEDCTVELRQASGRTVWKTRLPTPPKSAFRATPEGWISDDGLLLDRTGRYVSCQAGLTNSTPAPSLSDGAWDPVTTIVDDAQVTIGPVFTAEGDAVAIVFKPTITAYAASCVRSRGASGTWDAPERLPVDWFQGALIPDGLGNLTFVYRDFNNPVSEDTLSAIRYTPLDGWGEPMIIGRVPTYFQSVTGAADAQGNIVVATGDVAGIIYTASWEAASQTWSPITKLTNTGSIPTMTVSPDRHRIVLAYGVDFRGMMLQSFTAQQGWAQPKLVPGSNRIVLSGGGYSRLPVMVDNAGNVTTFWEARVRVFINRYVYSVYGAYVPAQGTEPALRLMPWVLNYSCKLYDFGDWGLSPAGNAMAVVTRLAPEGIDCLAMTHDVQAGWQPTATPFQYDFGGLIRSRMAWRNDESALAVVRNGTQGLTTLFFENAAWSDQTQNLPAGTNTTGFDLAGRNADVVGLFLFAPGLNATWYRGAPGPARRADVGAGRRSRSP